VVQLELRVDGEIGAPLAARLFASAFSQAIAHFAIQHMDTNIAVSDRMLLGSRALAELPAGDRAACDHEAGLLCAEKVVRGSCTDGAVERAAKKLGECPAKFCGDADAVAPARLRGARACIGLQGPTR
jgi:hypothetical protein